MASSTPAVPQVVAAPGVPKEIDELPVGRRGLNKRAILAAGGVLIGVIAVGVPALFSEDVDDDVICPGDKMSLARAVAKPVPGTPSALLLEATDALSASNMDAARRALDKCSDWADVREQTEDIGVKGDAPNGGVKTTAATQLTDVVSQMQCHALKLEHFGITAATEQIEAQSKDMMEQGRAQLQRCNDLAGQLQAIRRSDGAAQSPGRALQVLTTFGQFESSAAEVLQGLTVSQGLLEREGGELAEGEEEILPSKQGVGSLRASMRGCLLRGVREARSVAASLPSTAFTVRRAAKCTPTMLAGIEDLAVREAAGELDAGVRFALGMHQSEVAILLAEKPTPLFGAKMELDTLAVDQFAMEVPQLVATSEELLLDAKQLSTGAHVQQRAVLLGKRLSEHALGVLTPLNFREAVSARFRAAAQVFAAYDQTKFAGRAFSDLAQHLLSGREHEAALAAAKDALSADRDEPVALVLDALLRRDLGELRTDSEVKRAVKQLKRAAGRVPNKDLEAKRAWALTEISGWAAVKEAGDISTCLELQDAARVAICVIARLTYG